MAARVCWIIKVTRAPAHVIARLPTTTHTHIPTRARALISTHLRTYTQKYVILIGFPRKQWLRERASVLRYMYIACLVV